GRWAPFLESGRLQREVLTSGVSERQTATGIARATRVPTVRTSGMKGNIARPPLASADTDSQVKNAPSPESKTAIPIQAQRSDIPTARISSSATAPHAG